MRPQPKHRVTETHKRTAVGPFIDDVVYRQDKPLALGPSLVVFASCCSVPRGTAQVDSCVPRLRCLSFCLLLLTTSMRGVCSSW